jgi:hypothetical protein
MATFRGTAAPFVLHYQEPLGRSLKVGVSRSSGIDTVDAQTLCFQLTANFPSWMSPVRSRSPAPIFQALTGAATPGVCSFVFRTICGFTVVSGVSFGTLRSRVGKWLAAAQQMLERYSHIRIKSRETLSALLARGVPCRRRMSRLTTHPMQRQFRARSSSFRFVVGNQFNAVRSVDDCAHTPNPGRENGAARCRRIVT